MTGENSHGCRLGRVTQCFETAVFNIFKFASHFYLADWWVKQNVSRLCLRNRDAALAFVYVSDSACIVYSTRNQLIFSVKYLYLHALWQTVQLNDHILFAQVLERLLKFHNLISVLIAAELLTETTHGMPMLNRLHLSCELYLQEKVCERLALFYDSVIVKGLLNIFFNTVVLMEVQAHREFCLGEFFDLNQLSQQLENNHAIL